MFKKLTIIQIIQLLALIIAVIFTIITTINKLRDDSRMRRIANELDRYSVKSEIEFYSARLDSITELNKSLHARLNSLIKTDSTTRHPSYFSDERYLKIEKEINQLNNNYLKLNNQNLAIRQALNPINPEEVLTIARLNDEIKNIHKAFSTFKDNVELKQTEFRDYILREKESTNRATSLILVVLVPLVLNFLYTVWKDFKKDTTAQNTESQTKKK